MALLPRAEGREAEEAHEVAHFCWMNITRDMRDKVAKMGPNEIAALGYAEARLGEKSAEFLQEGGKLYVEAG